MQLMRHATANDNRMLLTDLVSIITFKVDKGLANIAMQNNTPKNPIVIGVDFSGSC